MVHALFPQLLLPAQSEQDDHQSSGGKSSILHLHHRKMSKRLHKSFQSKGNQEEDRIVHDTPLIGGMKVKTMHFLPDPHNEEEEAWRERSERVGERPHHLKMQK